MKSIYLSIFSIAMIGTSTDDVHAVTNIPKACNLKQISVSGDSLEKCNLSAKQYMDVDNYSECQGVLPWAKRVAVAESTCIEKIMNREVARRNIRVKKKMRKQLKVERELHENFRKAVVQACEPLKTCEGQSFKPMRGNCISSFWTYRILQIAQLNSKNLELTDNEGTDSAAEGHPFKPFAEKVCALPADMWKEKKVPEKCERKVLASLDYKKDPCSTKGEEASN